MACNRCVFYANVILDVTEIGGDANDIVAMHEKGTLANDQTCPFNAR